MDKNKAITPLQATAASSVPISHLPPTPVAAGSAANVRAPYAAPVSLQPEELDKAAKEQLKRLDADLKKPSTVALFAAAFRFFLAISCCLGLSVVFNDQRIGGFACVATFMVLLADSKTGLWSRLLCTLIVLVTVVAAVVLGYLCKNLIYGKWLVIVIACFGAGLMPSLENFWWFVGKYFLVFLMISLFDFSPDASALAGYGLGYLVSVVIIILDSLMWKVDRLGVRPMDQIKNFIGGVRNPKSFAVISAFVLLFALWSALALGFKEPAWVGITVIYLMNTKISVGVKKSVERVLGTALGYALVVFIFAFPEDYQLFILGPIIVIVGTPIPIFLSINYLLYQTCVTAYILLALEWLSNSYGGDASLLGWRLLDTCYGAACAIVGFALIITVGYIERKHDEKKFKKAELAALELKVLNQRMAEQQRYQQEQKLLEQTRLEKLEEEKLENEENLLKLKQEISEKHQTPA